MGHQPKQEKREGHAAIGIGAMIVFIAMVLVAGIAATVLISTSSQLEAQTLLTGKNTEKEVASGIAIEYVEGRIHDSTNKIDQVLIMVRPRSGSPHIDLSRSKLEISDGENKYFLSYLNTEYRSAPPIGGVYTADGFGDLSADDFGIIEIKDADNSSHATSPILNRGDKVLIMINVSTTFTSTSGWGTNTRIWGRLLPLDGAAGEISFRTPLDYYDTIQNLQI